MKDIVCACSSSFIKDTPIVDINNIEESQAGVEVRMLAYTYPNIVELVHFWFLSLTHSFMSPEGSRAVSRIWEIFRMGVVC